MKILILTNNDMGLYKFRKELLEALLGAGHQIFLSLPNGPFVSQLQNLGCRFIETGVDRRGTNPLADYKLYRTYIRNIKTIKPNIVFTYTIKPNVYGGMACQACNVPYLANVTGLGTSIENGGFLQKITMFLYRKGLKGAKKVFFQNQNNLDFMIERNVVSEKQCELLPGSGVNLKYFEYTEYPSEEKGVRFLFIGRVMKDKGIEELLEAFQELKKKYPNNNLAIVGDFDGPYQDKIRECEKKGLIQYLGILKDVRSEIAKAHCIVLPSYHEGMANVLLEASSMGRPVIATNVSGCKETFEDDVTGIGCRAKDVVSLLQAMLKFVNLTHKQRTLMGQKARKRMEEKFSREIVLCKYLEAIEK